MREFERVSGHSARKKEKMKSQVLWFVIAQATKEIIIPPDDKGTLCQCFTHHVVSAVDKVREIFLFVFLNTETGTRRSRWDYDRFNHDKWD